MKTSRQSARSRVRLAAMCNNENHKAIFFLVAQVRTVATDSFGSNPGIDRVG